METATLRILVGIVFALAVAILIYLLIRYSRSSNTHRQMFPIEELHLVFSTGIELEYIPSVQAIPANGLVESRLSNGSVTIIYRYLRDVDEFTESFEVSHPDYLGIIIHAKNGALSALQRVGGKVLVDPVLTQREKTSVVTFMRLFRAQVRKKVRK